MPTVMIHQPEYLPWMNLFFKMALSDVFVFLDTVQYSRRSFQNRNKIKTKLNAKWLTVPLKYAPRDEIVMKVKIDSSQNWEKQHLNLINDSYNSAAYFKEIFSLMEPVYARRQEYLSELNCDLTMKIAEILGIRTKFIKSSELSVKGRKSELILNICLKLGARRYISGIGAKAYLDEDKFIKNDIDIIYLPPAKIEYRQVHPEIGFIPDLSAIDYLFNNGTKDFWIDLRKYMTNCGIEGEFINGNA
ncbi:WbqC-like protein family protein [bacterium BMS3Abin10]|nr:WbqC-like protein family protein [bacterium BMS3Abin10]GBE39917.1 WbqC-like protein family protein [bacterium BMS3Bbin08]